MSFMCCTQQDKTTQEGESRNPLCNAVRDQPLESLNLHRVEVRPHLKHLRFEQQRLVDPIFGRTLHHHVIRYLRVRRNDAVSDNGTML